MDPPGLNAALDQLLDAGLIFRHGTPPDARYRFKHALVQDAAYDSLLKTQRRTIHAAIAGALESRSPTAGGSDPALLAQHWFAAGEVEKAIVYSIRAGTAALQAFTLREALEHLNGGLQMALSLAPSRQRNTRELEIRLALARAWLGLAGWRADGVREHLEPARELADSLGRDDVLGAVYWGLSAHAVVEGQLRTGLALASTMIAVGDQKAADELLLAGHEWACVARTGLGEFTAAQSHLAEARTRYDAAAHAHLVEAHFSDPLAGCQRYASIGLWLLGYPERAEAMRGAAVAQSMIRQHPFDLATTLFVTGLLLEMKRDSHALVEVAAALREVSLDAGILGGDLSAALHTALAAREQEPDVFAIQYPAILSALHVHGEVKPGTGFWLPYLRARLGEALALGDDVAAGLREIDASLEQIARPGWEERWHLAEILRIKAGLLERAGDEAGAERQYFASLEVAREQQAKAWELRTATHLAKLWQRQGKSAAAHGLLAPVYAWFSEGFDTPDLVDARQLLG
jgi:hypothetical protein